MEKPSEVVLTARQLIPGAYERNTMTQRQLGSMGQAFGATEIPAGTSSMDTETTRLTSGLYMAVLGAGMGCLMQITMLVAQNSVEMKDMGVASSSTTLFRTLGSSFGVAIMGALFNNRVQDVMAERAGAMGGKVAEHSTQLTAEGLAKLPDVVRDAYLHAVSAGTHSA